MQQQKSIDLQTSTTDIVCYSRSKQLVSVFDACHRKFTKPLAAVDLG